jgi:hypothetical protein
MHSKKQAKTEIRKINAEANKMAELDVTTLPAPAPKEETPLLDSLIKLSRSVVMFKHDQIRREGVICDIERLLVENDLLLVK